MSAEDYVTIEQAAGYLEKSRRTVYEYLRDGEGIRRIRVRNTLFIHLPDLVQYESTVPTPGRPRKERSAHD